MGAATPLDRAGVLLAWAFVALALPGVVPSGPPLGMAVGHAPRGATSLAAPSPPNSAVANFTAALNRLVELVGLAGSAILTLVWARVALSWFSNDLAKKIQAKDRARDALIGTLLFVAAVSGLVWGLAHWVVTGT